MSIHEQDSGLILPEHVRTYAEIQKEKLLQKLDKQKEIYSSSVPVRKSDYLKTIQNHEKTPANQETVMSIITDEFNKLSDDYPMESVIECCIKSLTSFIEPDEVKDAINFVEAHLGFERPRACGYYMALKVHIEQGDYVLNEDGTPSKILRADPRPTHEKYQSYVGLVVSLGSGCYTGERYKYSGPWCRVGDYVVFARHDGPHFNYRGIPMAMVPDDKVYMVIEDPDHVKKI